MHAHHVHHACDDVVHYFPLPTDFLLQKDTPVLRSIPINSTVDVVKNPRFSLTSAAAGARRFRDSTFLEAWCTGSLRTYLKLKQVLTLLCYNGQSKSESTFLDKSFFYVQVQLVARTCSWEQNINA
jgi:hypothetical protein